MCETYIVFSSCKLKKNIFCEPFYIRFKYAIKLFSHRKIFAITYNTSNNSRRHETLIANNSFVHRRAFLGRSPIALPLNNAVIILERVPLRALLSRIDSAIAFRSLSGISGIFQQRTLSECVLRTLESF